jgi:3-hydroxybutyryl-CoA dehydrogenase
LKKNKKKPEKNTKTTVKVSKTSSKNRKKEVPETPNLPTEKHTLPKVEVPRSQENHKSEKALVYLVGEVPMVEQYAEICIAYGYDVCVSWNESLAKKQNTFSSGIIISSTVPENISVAIELTNIDVLIKKKNLEKLAKALPETAPILSSSITITATEQSAWIAGKHRLVGIAALPTFIDKSLVEVAPTIYTPMETLEVVSRFFLTIGKEIEIVQDRVGMVLPRILCQVINEAAFAIMEDVAAPDDIDKALTLGMHFPLGPIEWAEHIGLDQVYAVLTALHTDLQEERYRVAPILKQMALTGVWWKQSSAH